VAGLVADGLTRVAGVECVKKTFPDFVHQMQGIGADVETT
jgi:5-enolpyruvylshikimate-3-phosphate synthase